MIQNAMIDILVVFVWYVLGVVLWLRRRFKNARLARQIYADEQALIAEKAKNEPKTPAE